MIRRWALVFVLGAAPAAHAAHPFITDDPGTQGKGRVELELGFAWREGVPELSGRDFAFTPQLSYGVVQTVDLIVQPVWLSQSPEQGPTVIGSGDTALDVKWRFYESEKFAAAVRAGLDLPTGNSDEGFGAGKVGWHAIAIASVSFGEYAVWANLGYKYTRAPDTRSNLGAASIALVRPDDRPLRGFVEVATFSNPDPSQSQWPAVVRAGGIYTVHEGLDVDAGYQARLNRSAARAALLLGVTVRW